MPEIVQSTAHKAHVCHKRIYIKFYIYIKFIYFDRSDVGQDVRDYEYHEQLDAYHMVLDRYADPAYSNTMIYTIEK